MNGFTVSSLAVVAAALLPAGVYAKARVAAEAESAATVEAPMVLVRKDAVPENSRFIAGASGDAYLEIPQGAGNPPQNPAGQAVLKVDVPADGEYTLWCRVWWEDECANSFTIRIDDSAPFLFGENATYKTWHWVRYPVARTAKPIHLAKGAHTVSFLNREDGVRLDQVVLSADKRFVPIEREPVGVKEK